MSYLDQFPSQPRRPKDVPGNDGYVLYRQPGFAEEQQCYRIVYQTTYTADYSSSDPVPVTHQINLNFPNVKLGRNNYVLDLARVDMSVAMPSTNDDTFNTESVAMVTLSNIGDTYQVVEGTSSITSDAVVYLPWDSDFRPRYNGSTTTFRSVYGSGQSAHSVYEYGYVIPSDVMALSFSVTDDLFVRSDYSTLSKKCGLAKITKIYTFVVRPNPCKRTYFDM